MCTLPALNQEKKKKTDRSQAPGFNRFAFASD